MAKKWRIFEIMEKGILFNLLIKLEHQPGIEPGTY